MMNKMIGDDADDATDDDGDVIGHDKRVVMTKVMMEDVMMMKLMKTMM